jgi:hypothetical protein
MIYSKYSEVKIIFIFKLKHILTNASMLARVVQLAATLVIGLIASNVLKQRSPHSTTWHVWMLVSKERRLGETKPS